MLKNAIVYICLASCFVASPQIHYTEPQPAEPVAEQPQEQTQEQTQNPGQEQPADQNTEQAQPEATATDAGSQRIYNATSTIYIIQGTAAIDEVIQKINTLANTPAQQVGIDEIKETRYLYNALTMAQKARVPNEQALFDLETSHGIVYDYATIYAKYGENDDVSSGDSVMKGTLYTISSIGTNSLSLSLKYTVDNNLDGILDVPEITIKKPNADIITVSKENTELHDSDMNIKITWTDTFMQMDIASLSSGKWTVQTNEPVIFSQMEYAGSKQDIAEIPDVENKHTDTDADKSNTDSSSNILLFVKLGFVVVVIVLLICLPKILSKTSKNKKNSDEQDKPNMAKKKEETLEELKAEFEQMLSAEDYSDNNDNFSFEEKKKETPIELSQEEISKSMTDIEDDSDILYWRPGDPVMPDSNQNKIIDTKEKEVQSQSDNESEKKGEQKETSTNDMFDDDFFDF